MESGQHTSSVTGIPNVLHSKAFYTAELKPLDHDAIKESDQSLVKNCKLERYYCDKCLFTTKDPQLYKKHIFQHDEIKFVCSYCNHVSYTKGEFQWHLVSHTGNFPYKCDYCEYGAVRKDYIVKHTKRVHEILKIKGPSNLGSEQFMTNARSIIHVPQTLEKTIKSEPQEVPINTHLPLDLEVRSQPCKAEVQASGTSASIKYSAFVEANYVQVELIAPLQTVKPGMPLTVVAPSDLTVPANCLAEVVELKLINGVQQLLLKLIPDKETSSEDVGTDGRETKARVRENLSNRSVNCGSSFSQGMVSSNSFTCTRRLAKTESPQSCASKAWQMQTPIGSLGAYNAKLKMQVCGGPPVEKPDTSKVLNEKNQVVCNVSRGSSQESSSLSLGKFSSEPALSYQRTANHSNSGIRASQESAAGNILERSSSDKCFTDKRVVNRDISCKEKVYTHSSIKVETCTATLSSEPPKGHQSNSLLESSCRSFKGLPSEQFNSTPSLKHESESYLSRSHDALLTEETRQGPRISSVFSLNCRPVQAPHGAKRNLEHGSSMETGSKIKRMNTELSSCPELQTSNTGSRFNQPCVPPRSSPLETYQANVQISKSPVANIYQFPGQNIFSVKEQYSRAYGSSLAKGNHGYESSASLGHSSSPAQSQSLVTVSRQSETSSTSNSSSSHAKFVQSLRPPNLKYSYAANHVGETSNFRSGKTKDLEADGNIQKCERVFHRDFENISEPDSTVSKNRTYHSNIHYSRASLVPTSKLQSSPVHDGTQPKVGTLTFYETCSEDANTIASSSFDYSMQQKTVGIGFSPFQGHKEKISSTFPSQAEKKTVSNARENIPVHYCCHSSTQSDVKTEMSVPVVKVQSPPAQDSTHSKTAPSGFYDSSTTVKSSLSSYPIYRMQQTVDGFNVFQSPNQKPESIVQSGQNDKKAPLNTRENVYPHYYCNNSVQHSGSSEVSKQPNSSASSPLHDGTQSKKVTSSALNEHCTASIKNSMPSNSEYGLQKRMFDTSFNVFQNSKQKADKVLLSPQNDQSPVSNMRENMSLPYLFQRNLLSSGPYEFSNCSGRLPPSGVHDHTCSNSGSSLFHDQCSVAVKNAVQLNSDYGIQQKTADRLDIFQNHKQKPGSVLPLTDSERNPSLNSRESIPHFPFVFQSTFMPSGAPELLTQPDRAPPSLHNTQSNSVSSVLYENSSLAAKSAVSPYPYYSMQQRTDIGFSAFQDPKQKNDNILPLSQTENFILTAGGALPTPFYCHSSMNNSLSSDLIHTKGAPSSPMHDPSRSKFAISSVLYEKSCLSDKNAVSSNSDFVCLQKTVDSGFSAFQSTKHSSSNAFSSSHNEKNHVLNAVEGISNPYYCQGSMQPSRMAEIPSLGVGSLSSPMHSTQSKGISSVLYEKCLFAPTSSMSSYPPYSMQQKAVDTGFGLFPSPKGMLLSPQNENSHVLSAGDMSVPYYCQSSVLSSEMPEITNHSVKSLPVRESAHLEAPISSLFEKNSSPAKISESLGDSDLQQKTDEGFIAFQTPKQKVDVLSVQKNEASSGCGTDENSTGCCSQVIVHSRNLDISEHSFKSLSSPRHKVQPEKTEPSTFYDVCVSAAETVSTCPDFKVQQKSSCNSFAVFHSPKEKLVSISVSQNEHDAVLNKKEVTPSSYYCHDMLPCSTSEMSDNTVASFSPQNGSVHLKAAFSSSVGKTLSLVTSVSSTMNCSEQQQAVDVDSRRTPESEQLSGSVLSSPQSTTHPSLSSEGSILTSPCHKSIQSTVACEVARCTDNLLSSTVEVSGQNSVLSALHTQYSSAARMNWPSNPGCNAAQKSENGFIVHQNSVQQKDSVVSSFENENVLVDYHCQGNACEFSTLSSRSTSSSRQVDTLQIETTAPAALNEMCSLATKSDESSKPDHSKQQKTCHSSADGLYVVNRFGIVLPSTRSTINSDLDTRESTVTDSVHQSSAFNDAPRISDLGAAPSPKQGSMQTKAVSLSGESLAKQNSSDPSKPVCSLNQKSDDGFSVIQNSKTLNNILSPQQNESISVLSTGKNISSDRQYPNEISGHADMSPFAVQENMESKPDVISSVCVICPSTLQIDVVSNQNFNVEQKSDSDTCFDSSQQSDGFHSLQNEKNQAFNAEEILTGNYCQSSFPCQVASAVVSNADRSHLSPSWGSMQAKSNTLILSEVNEEHSSAVNGSSSLSNDNMQKAIDSGSKSFSEKSGNAVALSPSEGSSVLNLKGHSENSDTSRKSEISSHTNSASSISRDDKLHSTSVLGKPCNAVFKDTVTLKQDCDEQQKASCAAVTELQTPSHKLISPLPSDSVSKSEANSCKTSLHSSACSEILDHVSGSLSPADNIQVASGVNVLVSEGKGDETSSFSDCNLNGLSTQFEMNCRDGSCEQYLQTRESGRMLNSASSAKLSPSSDSAQESTVISVISQQCTSSASACSMVLMNDVSVNTAQNSNSDKCHISSSEKENSPVLNGTRFELNALHAAASHFAVKDCFKISEQSDKTCGLESPSNCKSENSCSIHLKHDLPLVLRQTVSKDHVEFNNMDVHLTSNKVADVHVISIGKIQLGEEPDFETDSNQHLEHFYKLSFRTDCGYSGKGATKYLSCTVKTKNNAKTDFHDDAPIFIPKDTLLKVLNSVPLQCKTLAEMGRALEDSEFCHDVLLPRPVPFSVTQSSVLSSNISEEIDSSTISEETKEFCKLELKNEGSSKGMLENDAAKCLGKDCSSEYDDLGEQSVSYKSTSVSKTPMKRKSYVEEKWHKAKRKCVLHQNDLMNNIKHDSAGVRVRQLHLLCSSGNQLVKCSSSTMPVIVLSCQDIAVPEVANLMRKINKMKGGIKGTVSEKSNNCLSIMFQSLMYQVFAPVRLINEHHILKINPKRFHASRHQTSSVTNTSLQHPRQCWFCGRVYFDQKKWFAHGRCHLKDTSKSRNALSLCAE